MAQTNRFLLLLLLLIVFLFFLGPVHPGSTLGALLRRVVFGATLLAGAYSVTDNRKLFVLATVLAVPPVLLGFGTALGSGSSAGVMQLVLASASLTLTSVLILAHIVRVRHVTVDTLFGGLCVYLLLGAVWALLFRIIHVVNPNAFSIPQHFVTTTADGASTIDMSVFTYFSFSTLTTLGYGDISPISPIARSMTSLEASAGQLYIAILVAGLVSVHIAQAASRTDR